MQERAAMMVYEARVFFSYSTVSFPWPFSCYKMLAYRKGLKRVVFLFSGTTILINLIDAHPALDTP